ncbi:MAG: DUF3540 domain-containing protein [Deltaproteobacteria bacterium]|nr:DUF3540 domain-containing protein [Deltaproteobacteria bacterium]
MLNVVTKYGWMTETRYLGPAQVLEVDETENRVLLSLAGLPEGNEAWAQVALAGFPELTPGDTALVIGEDLSALYVIGLLNRKETSAGASKKIALSGGTYATTTGPPWTQKLRILSNRNELLFEYDEETNKARVNLESGDLEFVTHNGNISFTSGREILLQGQSVGVRAQRGDFQVEETTYTGKKLLGKIDGVKLIAERIETAAQSLIEKAKNVYRTVEQLSQLKTGRMRTLVNSTFHFKAKKAFLKAEEDYKIKAEKIHLG